VLAESGEVVSVRPDGEDGGQARAFVLDAPTASYGNLPWNVVGSPLDEVETTFKGNWHFATRGAYGPARLTVAADRVSVSGRLLNREGPYDFPYSEIEAAHEARVLLDPGVAVLLRDGSCWYFWTRSRKTVLDALRAQGVPVLNGIKRLRSVENTEGGIARAKRRWEEEHRSQHPPK
jgi:hypothetical protein